MRLPLNRKILFETPLGTMMDFKCPVCKKVRQQMRVQEGYKCLAANHISIKEEELTMKNDIIIKEDVKLVKIPKDVAEAIDEAWNVIYRVGGMQKHAVLTDWKRLEKDNGPELKETLYQYFLNHPNKYISALTDGYEIERTPEDQLLQLYREAEAALDDNPSEELTALIVGKLEGIELSVMTLGLCIPEITEIQEIPEKLTPEQWLKSYQNRKNQIENH